MFFKVFFRLYQLISGNRCLYSMCEVNTYSDPCNRHHPPLGRQQKHFTPCRPSDDSNQLSSVVDSILSQRNQTAVADRKWYVTSRPRLEAESSDQCRSVNLSFAMCRTTGRHGNASHRLNSSSSSSGVYQTLSWYLCLGNYDRKLTT